MKPWKAFRVPPPPEPEATGAKKEQCPACGREWRRPIFIGSHVRISCAGCGTLLFPSPPAETSACTIQGHCEVHGVLHAPQEQPSEQPPDFDNAHDLDCVNYGSCAMADAIRRAIDNPGGVIGNPTAQGIVEEVLAARERIAALEKEVDESDDDRLKMQMRLQRVVDGSKALRASLSALQTSHEEACAALKDIGNIPFPYSEPNTIGPLSVRLVNTVRAQVLRRSSDSLLGRGWGNADNDALRDVQEDMRLASRSLLARVRAGVK